MNTAPYKQAPPNNRLTVDRVMSHRSKSRQIHLSEAQGCYVEASVKGGDLQKLDHVTAVVSG